jgi:hypothetical protein
MQRFAGVVRSTHKGSHPISNHPITGAAETACITQDPKEKPTTNQYQMAWCPYQVQEEG